MITDIFILHAMSKSLLMLEVKMWHRTVTYEVFHDIENRLEILICIVV